MIVVGRETKEGISPVRRGKSTMASALAISCLFISLELRRGACGASSSGLVTSGTFPVDGGSPGWLVVCSGSLWDGFTAVATESLCGPLGS